MMTQRFANILIHFVSQISVPFQATEIQAIFWKKKCIQNMVCCTMKNWIFITVYHENNFLCSMKCYIFIFGFLLQFVYQWHLSHSIYLHIEKSITACLGLWHTLPVTIWPKYIFIQQMKNRHSKLSIGIHQQIWSMLMQFSSTFLADPSHFVCLYNAINESAHGHMSLFHLQFK